MSCVLNILGEDLDIDRFVEESGIHVFEKKYKGDIIPGHPSHIRKRKWSSLTLVISEAGFDDAALQIENTISFLESNKDKLKLIPTFKGIDSASINLGIDAVIDNYTLAQHLLLPIKLICICASLHIEIELSIYSKDMNRVVDERYNLK
jgi:hypothetical protein